MTDPYGQYANNHGDTSLPKVPVKNSNKGLVTIGALLATMVISGAVAVALVKDDQVPASYHRELQASATEHIESYQDVFLMMMTAYDGTTEVPEYDQGVWAYYAGTKTCEALREGNKAFFDLDIQSNDSAGDWPAVRAAGNILYWCNDQQERAVAWGLPTAVFDRFPVN